MKSKRNRLKAGMILSCFTMILALSWLIICLPFVYESQQSLMQNTEQGQTDPSNPLSGTTEERHESSVNTLSEYLHDIKEDQHHSQIIEKYFKCHPSDLYYEYHPELISPPPEA